MKFAPRFEVFPGRGKQWFWRLVGGNGEVIAASEGYTRKTDARRAARKIRTALAGDVEIVEVTA